jgi:hypothetical protein
MGEKRKESRRWRGAKFVHQNSSPPPCKSVFLFFCVLLFCDYNTEFNTDRLSFSRFGVGATRLDACALNLLDGVNISSSETSEDLVSRLDGLTLTVAAIWDPGYVSIEGEAAPTRTRDYPDVYCTDCGSQLSGYNFDVFEKMASLGNFKTNWTIFGDVDSSRGETYEQMALNFTRDFDVSGQWWSDTARRRSIGISCGYYHTDITRILTVSKQAGSGGKIDYFSFLAPLSWQVWLTLIFA